MQRLTKRIFVVTCGLALGAAILWHTSRPEAIPVTVASVERARVESTVANTRAGSIETCQRARLAPAMGGQVAKLLVKRGDAVEKGQPLMEFWNEDLTARLRLAESEAKAARARSEEACIRAEIAARSFERAEELYRQRLTAEESFDKARTEMRASAAACNAAKANAQVSSDQVALARANLGRTRITAPFKGVVAEITGEPGEYVTPSPPGIPTPPAIDLVDPVCLYVAAPIDEVDAPKVEECMPARITLDAFGKQHFNGQVRRISPYVLDVEKQARTVEVEVFFSEPEQIDRLLPGYSADVEIILDAHDNTLRIPTEALLEGNRVLVFDAQSSTLVERTIKPGLANWQYTEVLEGLREAEQVVTSVQREGIKAGAFVALEPAKP